MPTNYPSGIDTFSAPSNPEGTPLSGSGDSTRNHVESHRDLADATMAVQQHMALNSHDHSGSGPRATPKLTQSNTHQSPGTDASPSSIHHTIGTGANQAAAGNHRHTKSDGLGLFGTDNSVVNPSGAISSQWFDTPPYGIRSIPRGLTVGTDSLGPHYIVPTNDTMDLGSGDGFWMESGRTYAFSCLHWASIPGNPQVPYSLILKTSVSPDITLGALNYPAERGVPWRRTNHLFEYTGPTQFVNPKLTISRGSGTPDFSVNIKDIVLREAQTPPSFSSYNFSSIASIPSGKHYFGYHTLTKTQGEGPLSDSMASLITSTSGGKTSHAIELNLSGYYTFTVSIAQTLSGGELRKLFGLVGVTSKEQRMSLWPGNPNQTLTVARKRVSAGATVSVGSYVAGSSHTFSGSILVTYLGD